MKFSDILKSASSNLLRNKGRTILTIVAIFIGAFTIALTNGVNIGVNDYIDKQIEGVGGEDQILIYPNVSTTSGDSSEPAKYDETQKSASMTESQLMNDADIKEIGGIKGIKKSEAVKMAAVDYIQGEDGEKYVFSSMPTFDSLTVDLEAGRKVDQNSSEYEINLAPEYVKSLGFKSAKDAIDKTVKLAVSSTATQEQKVVEAKIVGVRNTSLIQGGMSLLNKALIDELVKVNEDGLPEKMKNQYSMAVAYFDSNDSKIDVAKIKKSLEDNGYMGQTVEDEIGMIRDVVNAITGVLTLFGAIALLAASFGIINTLFMSVQERTREIGLMKAMGLSSFKVFMIFSIEAMLIGFFGSLLGILGAMGIGSLVNQVATDSFLSALTGFTLVQFSFGSSIIIILIIMLIAFLAGTLPARRAAKLDPIESLRYE